MVANPADFGWISTIETPLHIENTISFGRNLKGATTLTLRCGYPAEEELHL
jgi:hypothetical protein